MNIEVPVTLECWAKVFLFEIIDINNKYRQYASFSREL